MITQKLINDISYRIIGCAIEVHKYLGPGLLESVYHTCMMDEFLRNDLAFHSHVAVPINYKGRQLAEPLRLDLLIEDLIVVELKAVETIHPVYSAQLLSYLKLADKAKGLLIKPSHGKYLTGYNLDGYRIVQELSELASCSSRAPCGSVAKLTTET